MNAIQRKRLSKRRRLCLSAVLAFLLALLLTVGDSERAVATRQQQAWPLLDEELAQAVGRTAVRVREQALPVRTPATRTAARPQAALPARAASAVWLEPLTDADDEVPPAVALQPAEPQPARQTAEQDPAS